MLQLLIKFCEGVQIVQQHTKIGAYLKTVCEQIRWKKAHDVISEEIENHLLDQKDAFMAAGLDEETATDKAILEMGDPIFLGLEFDRTHTPKVEWSIIGLTGIALLLGLVLRIFVLRDVGMSWSMTNSIISTVIGVGCMTMAYFLDFSTIGKYPKTIYFGLLALTIWITFTPIVNGGITFISPIINGQNFRVQFLLLLFPTAFAGIIYNMRREGYLGIILSYVCLAIPALIGMINPNFSGVIVYTLTCLILLTFAIAKGWFNVKKLRAVLLVFIPTVMSAMVVIFTTIFNNPYRLQRLQNALNPSLDPMGAGYIGTITREMIANARFFGQGELGTSSGMMLPEIHTDFLLTYLIHRFGWISFIVIMTVLLAIIMRAFMLCSKQRSVLGKLIAMSVLTTFTLQVALYVANNLGFQLFAPLTLPLVSYGGTATVINMILIGIMLSVFKSGELFRDNLTTFGVSNKKLFEIVDGKIVIDLRL